MEVDDKEWKALARENFKRFFSLLVLAIGAIGLTVYGLVERSTILYYSGLFALVMIGVFAVIGWTVYSVREMANASLPAFFDRFEKKYNGGVVKGVSGSNSGDNWNDAGTLIGEYDGVQYSVEGVRRVGRFDVKISADCRTGFDFRIIYCGNLDPASDALKWVFSLGGKRHNEFWIKSDKPARAKIFCDQNYPELRRLLINENWIVSESGVDRYGERVGIIVKGGKISMFSGMSGKGVDGEFETLISIAKKYR